MKKKIVKGSLQLGSWECLDIKQVMDSDGFWTDYSMWYNSVDDLYVFIFGDSTVYNPENSDWDWEADDEDTAYEWFDNYTGFDEDDIESATKVTADYDPKKAQSVRKFKDIVVKDKPGKWYRFLHQIETETGLHVDSVSISHPNSQWIDLFDDEGDGYEAEVTVYYDGSLEFRGYNLAYTGPLD